MDLREVRAKEQRYGPIERDAKARVPPRHLKEVVRSPDPPREEAFDCDAADVGGGVGMSEGSHRSQRLEDERLRCTARRNGTDIPRHHSGGSHGMLREGGIDATSRRWCCCAVAKCPHIR